MSEVTAKDIVLDAVGYFEMLAERDALREAMREKGGERVEQGV